MDKKNIAPDSGRLKNFSISFLAIALGLVGFTLAWQKTEQILKIPFQFSTPLLYISIAVIDIIFLIYLFKLIKYPEEVKKEFNSPIKINFYPIVAKLFLILSIIYLSININFSEYLWWIGVIAQFVFTIIVMSRWISSYKIKIEHMNPAWFIPVVGSIIIPIAGIKFCEGISWFFFSVGLFWWMILTVLIVNRVIFHNPLPSRLIPTLFILFAPPVIGFISITKLVGELNIFGNLLYYFGLFMFILIFFQIKTFSRLKFYLSWWAYSFPMDALVIGTILMYHETKSMFFLLLSWILFILLNLLILTLAIKTILGIKNKNLCIDEED